MTEATKKKTATKSADTGKVKLLTAVAGKSFAYAAGEILAGKKLVDSMGAKDIKTLIEKGICEKAK